MTYPYSRLFKNCSNCKSGDAATKPEEEEKGSNSTPSSSCRVSARKSKSWNKSKLSRTFGASGAGKPILWLDETALISVDRPGFAPVWTGKDG